MKYLAYLLSGALFGLGLSLSGMIDAAKVRGFLWVTDPHWNPALLFVLASAVIVYFVIFRWKGAPRPASKRIDRKLIVGAAIFGVGWGLLGVCPGPALAHLPYLDLRYGIFLATMYAGFFLQSALAFQN